MEATSTGVRAIGVLTVVAAMLKIAAAAAAAGMIWIHVCGSWTPASSSTGGTVGVARSSVVRQASVPPSNVQQGRAATDWRSSELRNDDRWRSGASWQINAPQGFVDRRSAHRRLTGMVSYGVNPPTGVGAAGSTGKAAERRSTKARSGTAHRRSISTYFGWQIICGLSTCDGDYQARREVARAGARGRGGGGRRVRQSRRRPAAWAPPADGNAVPGL